MKINKKLLLLLCVVSLLIIFFNCNKNKQYIVIRNNCNDTLYIKADTFQLNPKTHTIYFIRNNKHIITIDSVNQIKHEYH